MNTYVLMVSRVFPATHSKKGSQTFFPEKISSGIKLHTIRGNYELWEKRIYEINSGHAKLSIRVWTGKPYKSPQQEILSTTKVGIQKLDDPKNFIFASIDGKKVDWELVAKNDGLSFEDFCDWFKVRTSEPMAVIHFTDFRY
jgi:hypothetical protein